ALLRLLAQIHPTGAILLLIGMVGVALVCARGLAALLMPRESDDSTFAESRTAIGVYGFAVLALVALGVFPQWLLPIIAREAAVFTGAGP
ncbi:MAG: hypothetical protein ACRDH2_20010, partial [Anaerolineales bacterium]